MGVIKKIKDKSYQQDANGDWYEIESPVQQEPVRAKIINGKSYYKDDKGDWYEGEPVPVSKPTKEEQPQELPPSNEIPTIEIETPDLFDLSKQYSELSNATKQVSEPTMAGGMTMGTTTTIKNVPDEEKRNQAKELSPVFEQEGIDPTDLYESTKTLTPTDYGYEGFTKPELLSDYKENKQLFDRKVARTQWKKGIDNALNEALINNNIDSDTYNYLQQSIESSLANSNVGDYKQQRQNINTVANIIKQFGGENKKEILDKYAVEVAKIYGNSDSFNFQKSYSESPESKYLTPSAALAYEYKKDIDPEGAKQFERVLIDPSKIKDEDEKRGYNHLMQTLEESGIGLRLNSVNEELNNLSRIAKTNGGLTPEQLELADKYEKQKQQLTVELNELDNKYPDRLVNKIDDAVQELMGQRQGYFNYAMGKTAQEIKNTGKGIWEALSTPFMSVEDNNMRELAIMGDKQVEDAVFHKVDKNKGLLTDKLVFSPELQTDIDAILNNKNLSDDKKKGDLYRLLADRKGEFGRVPIKGGKLNLNPASILYGVTDIAATLVPFVGLEAATGGIGGAGATARFLRTANAAFASSFHNEYAAAIQEGKAPSEAYKYAMGMNAISAAGMAGANTAEKVRMFFKGNTSASKIINSMTDDAIEQALKKTPKELSKFKSGVTSLVQGAKNRVKALPEQFKHGVKAGAEFEVAMTGARELQHQIYNNHIDREAGFKQSVLGMIAFPFLSMGIGQLKFRKPSELQKGSLLMVAEKPNDYIEQAKKMLDEGNLSKEQFEQVQTNIKVATLAYQKLSDANSGGSEMSEKSKAEFLANTALKIIGEKKAITEREKEQAAHRGLVLDYKNEFIRDEATSAELEKRLPQIEKELTPKKTAEGKEEPINPKLEKQLLAEKDAINEYIEEKSAEVAAENARKLNERKSVGQGNAEPTVKEETSTVSEKETEVPIAEIGDVEYNDFIDKGKVLDLRLNDIARKVKNQEPLSEREKEIFESTETTGQRNAETTTPVLEQKQGSGIVDGEGKPTVIEPNAGKETPKGQEPESIQMETVEGTPPKEPVAEASSVYIEPDRVIFSHRGLQEVATQFGLDDVTSRERKADIKLLKDADTTISEWVEKGEYNERVEEIVQRGKEGKPISDTENVIFAQHIANLKEQARQAREKNGISSKEYSDKVRELNDAVNVGTKMRSSAGATLRVSQMLARNYMESLDDAMAMKVEANKGADLTEKQKQVVEEQINEYKKRAEESEAALAEINAKFSEFQAEQNLKETQGTPRTKQVVKNGKRDFKAERLPLKERLKQEAAEFKAAGYKMGIASDGGGESFVISAKMAKTILEIGKNHLEELGEKIGYAAVKIKDVVDKTLVDVKESLGIDIKEQDIMDVLGGKYAKKRETESEINAKMRELKSEASLLNEYKRLIEGGEPKSERKKIARNQRLSALSKEIDKLKKEKGEGKYSPEAKAERLIKQNKKQQEEFERRLSKKDFDKKKKPESFIESPEFRQQNPELFNKVMDSINKKHEAQLEFEKGLFEEEWRNMQWTDQVKELGRKTFNTIKHLFASFDLSAIGVQNWPMIVNNPLIAYKAIKRSIGKDMFSQTEFDRFMTELHESPDFKLMMDSGLRVNEPKSLLDSGREDYFPQRFKATITVNGKTYGYVKIKGNKYELFDLSKPFERQFTSLGNVLRVIKFRTEAEKLKRDGYTFEKNPEEFKTLATRINNLTSSADIPQAFQNKVTNIMIWSTRLMAAKLNMLGISDLVALFPNSPIEKGYYRSLGVKGKLLSKQQKAAAKDLAGLAINVVAGTYLYALARGGTVNWNPDSNQFLDVQYGDGKSINLSGGFSRYIGMMVQMARLGKRDKQGVFRNYRGTDPLKETANFIAQKAPPITRAGMNLIVGKDAVGEPTDIATEASKLAFPLAAGQVWEQIEKDGMAGLFSEGIPTLLGFNTKDNRDSPKRHVFDAPSLNFIQKHQVPIDYPDAEYTKGGEKIKMTEDEYKEYVKAYDKAIEEIISHIKEKGAEIIRNDEAQTVSYNDLKDDEIKEYIKDELSYQMELYRSKTFDTKEVDEGEIQRKKDLNEDLKNLKNRPQF